MRSGSGLSLGIAQRAPAYDRRQLLTAPESLAGVALHATGDERCRREACIRSKHLRAKRFAAWRALCTDEVAPVPLVVPARASAAPASSSAATDWVLERAGLLMLVGRLQARGERRRLPYAYATFARPQALSWGARAGRKIDSIAKATRKPRAERRACGVGRVHKPGGRAAADPDDEPLSGRVCRMTCRNLDVGALVAKCDLRCDRERCDDRCAASARGPVLLGLTCSGVVFGRCTEFVSYKPSLHGSYGDVRPNPYAGLSASTLEIQRPLPGRTCFTTARSTGRGLCPWLSGNDLSWGTHGPQSTNAAELVPLHPNGAFNMNVLAWALQGLFGTILSRMCAPCPRTSRTRPC